MKDDFRGSRREALAIYPQGSTMLKQAWHDGVAAHIFGRRRALNAWMLRSSQLPSPPLGSNAIRGLSFVKPQCLCASLLGSFLFSSTFPSENEAVALLTRPDGFAVWGECFRGHLKMWWILIVGCAVRLLRVKRQDV